MKKIKSLFTEKQSLTVAMVAVIAVIAVVTVALLPELINNSNRRHVTQTASHLASMQAQALGKRVDDLQSHLLGQARSENIETLLQQGDPAALTALADKLRSSYEMVQTLSIIPVGVDYGSLNLRFAQIERLQRASKGEAVLPEAYQDNGNWMFDLVVPVKAADGHVAGNLLAVFSIKLLQSSLEQLPATMGETVWLQKFPQSREQTVAHSGSGQNLELVSDAVASNIPHWQVRVVPGPQLLDEAVASPAMLFAAQGVVIIACLLALWLVHRRTHAKLTVAAEARVTPIQIRGARKVDKNNFVVAEAAPATVATELADPLFQHSDLLDFDDDNYNVRPAEQKPATASTKARQSSRKDKFNAPANIFRDYDIRGNADREISDELAQRIGLAFGSECLESGQTHVILAGDGRLSTPRIKGALQQGLLASGCHVTDIGDVPTPLMYFATHTLGITQSGIMVTASHNPSEDNGFKMVIGGRTLASEQIQRLRDRVQTGDFNEGEGECFQRDVTADYINYIANDIVLAGSYRIVLDCGNGIAGKIAPRLFEELGCDVVPLYCDVDGAFPNHPADPSVLENLRALVNAVTEQHADLGVAFDGDGDRLAVVTANGDIILPDRLLMLFAKDIVSRNPGTDIVFDVKSTRLLNALISSYGGRPVMWKSGHSHIKNKVMETGALLGGELSGHIFFKERWFGFDDGMYSAARLLEIMSIRDQDLDSIFDSFPDSASTPEIRIAVPEDKKFAIVKRLAERGEWGNGKLSTLDGVRVDFAKGWGLVRASNTAAELTLRFEADDAETLSTVQYVFKQQLNAADKDLKLPF